MSDDNALSRAKKALAVVPGRELAPIDKGKIADLLKQATAATRRPAPLRAAEAKPPPALQPETALETHPPPAVRQPQATLIAPSPAGVVEPGPAPAPTVIVNVTTPAPYGYPPPPWWAWGWGPGCPAAFCPRRVGRACWRWSCPYW